MRYRLPQFLFHRRHLQPLDRGTVRDLLTELRDTVHLEGRSVDALLKTLEKAHDQIQDDSKCTMRAVLTIGAIDGETDRTII